MRLFCAPVMIGREKVECWHSLDQSESRKRIRPYKIMLRDYQSECERIERDFFERNTQIYYIFRHLGKFAMSSRVFLGDHRSNHEEGSLDIYSILVYVFRSRFTNCVNEIFHQPIHLSKKSEWLIRIEQCHLMTVGCPG